MEKPLVTLLLPCYNCEKTLDRFMRSVISESYRPLELICIDDGSTDDTAKLLKNFETILKESGVQYTVLTQENIGGCSTRTVIFSAGQIRMIFYYRALLKNALRTCCSTRRAAR